MSNPTAQPETDTRYVTALHHRTKKWSGEVHHMWQVRAVSHLATFDPGAEILHSEEFPHIVLITTAVDTDQLYDWFERQPEETGEFLKHSFPAVPTSKTPEEMFARIAQVIAQYEEERK